MKKIFFILLVQTVLFTACKLSLNENVGEVVLNFGESGRAIGSDGLPVFGTVPVEIKVYNTETEDLILTERVENAGENIMFQVPTGITIKIRVYLITPSGSWQGEAVHAVISGTNNVPIKLNKKIADLHGLLFTQQDTGNGYKLTFTLGTKTVNAPYSNGVKHVFNRDNRGRMYVAYKDTADWKLQRYTAEGEEDGSAFDLKDNSSPPQSVTPSVIMSDFTVGETYLVGTDLKVYEIGDTSLSDPSSTPLSFFKHVAAIDNGRIVWYGFDNPDEPRIYVVSNSNYRNIKDDIKIGNLPNGEVTDIFIRGNYAYVLFNAFNKEIENDNKRLYSLGGVLRYNINNLGEPPLKIGFNAAPGFENGVLNNYGYGNYFYGAVKVVGFDEDGLYMADDGFAAAYINEKAHIIKNRNRIAYLGFNTNALIFAETAVTWFNEYDERRSPNTKALLWEKGVHGFDYSGALSRLSDTSQQGYDDVFCFDQDGNLYVGKQNGPDYTIAQFKLKENGEEYNTNLITHPGFSTTPAPTCFAVDVSGANEHIENYLYYTENSTTIKRVKWVGAFSAASYDVGFTPITFDPDEEVTALAANKDGLFVAVKKVTNENDNGESYKITVKKYEHSGSSAGEATVVNETETHWNYYVGSTAEDANKYISENLNALHIKDGFLYAVTTKRIGVVLKSGGDTLRPDKSVITGKLIIIGKTSDFSVSPAPLYQTTLTGVDDINAATVSGAFSPYRFIALKPKKLIIASDGYYAKDNTSANMVQKNNVVIFNLDTFNIQSVNAEIEFSKIMTDTFEW
ncbi:hypothetical protein [Treponema pedis]|uniref:Lipoprotein n=1 Tax=Treponema pedis str. T A4 TaxID=1291379 RepID=S6A588_9SPIR|nr:hypothetical protein [Treponema pedis]AGT45156.1 hypothetical protein TPE_2684 [Treponema pedis str. T A4]